MAWIESHQGLREHPKTRRLMRFLSIPLPNAVGHLHCFWWWALDHAQDGNLNKYDVYDIADAAAWNGDAEIFVNGMVDAGFIRKENSEIVIHDWMDYAGRLIERRQKDAERKRKERDIQGMSKGSPKESIRNRTLTVPKPKPKDKDKDIYRTIQHLPLYVDEYDKLTAEYGKPAVDDVLDRMANYSKLKNYKSAYLTARNWLKPKEPAQAQTQDKPVYNIKDTYPDYDEAEVLRRYEADIKAGRV